MSKLVGIILLLVASIAGNYALAAAADDFDSYYDSASLNFRRGKYEEALKFYKKANSLRQNADLECLWGIAQTYGKLGAYRNALDACDLLIRAGGEEKSFVAKAWNLRGNTLFAASTINPLKQDDKKLQEAEAAYREVLKISSSLNLARYNLGCTLIRLKRVEEGVRELNIYVKNAVNDEEGAEKARRIIANPRRAVEYFAPDFSITTADGAYVSSDELNGKVVLLDFWGTWCKPCLNAIPYLSQLAKKYNKAPFALISVAARDEEAKWRDFIEQNKMNWTHTFDKGSKMQRAFNINAFPSYILIDQEGIVRYQGKGSGGQTESEISSAVKKALKALAEAPAQPKIETANATQAALNKIQDPIHSAAVEVQPPDAGSGLPDRRVSLIRIPKPIVEASRLNVTSDNPIALRSAPYRLQVKNWASYPDELFAAAKELPQCTGSSGVVIYRDKPAVSTRIEIQVLDGQGKALWLNCSMPSPDMLQSIIFQLPAQSQPGRVYVQIKDRLTGNMVQSDPVVLP